MWDLEINEILAEFGYFDSCKPLVLSKKHSGLLRSILRSSYLCGILFLGTEKFNQRRILRGA